MDFLTTDWLDESDESDLANDHGPRDDEIQVRWQSSQACPALKSLLVNAGGGGGRAGGGDGDKASGSGGSGDGDKRKNAFRGPNGSPRKSLSTGSIFGSAIAGPSSLLWGGEPQTRQGNTSAPRRPRALAAISRRDIYNSSTTTTTSSGSNANANANANSNSNSSSSSSSSDSLANFIQALQNVKAQVDENLHSKNLEYAAAAAAGKGLGRTGKVAKKPLSRVGRHGHGGTNVHAHLTAAGQPYPLTRRRTVTVDPVLGRAADVKGKGRALGTDRTVRERTRSSRPPSLMDIDDDPYCVQETVRGAESELVDADGMPPPALPPESDVEDAVMADAPPPPLPPQTRSFSRSHSTPHVDGGTAVRPLWAQQKPGITSRTTTNSAGPVSSISSDSTAAISTVTTAATAIATTATTTTGVTVKPSTTRLAPPAQNARPKSPVNGAPALPPSQHQQQQNQQQNRRPPVLGMRRVHTFSSSTTTTSGANTNGAVGAPNASQSRLGVGMGSQSRYAAPSHGQQLPTKQRGFKPPLLNRASTTTTTTAMTTGIRAMGATTGATTATSAASSAFKRTWSSGSTSTNSSSASGSALSGTTSGSAASTSSPSNTSRTSSFVHPGPTSSQTSSSEGDSPHPHRRVGSGGGSGVGGMRANVNARRAVPKTGFCNPRIEDQEEHEGRAVDEHEDKDPAAAAADEDDDFRMLSDDPNDSSYGDLIDFPFEEEALEEVMKMYD
ncbi:hypothetical protein CC1G_05869 [Coprinopsis cinerea okayama7|uniref:Uncharacterized protein n=1 Tax=Coprinopsis cinerea (strain Okayama-7 / 130 / ATCC MYA-4618 / FGSC 9003) TaxID=240176 RepID=A8NLN0_COPC7|nr:hypothetical protein CC1G_05869 [Coprinopsis cinerea okayama7\|eukprot:XP_001834732.2 hypothetical protein CC1G_05869 [Coprinopsis cinerea okayama7\